MKKTLLLLLLLSFGLVVAAQTYVGTMNVDGYKREEVKVTLRKTDAGDYVLTMYRVKFARLMPVKIDFDIPQMKLDNGRLTADDVVPVSKGKRYEKYTIHNLTGAASSNALVFTCKMGDKPFSFTGKRQDDKMD